MLFLTLSEGPTAAEAAPVLTTSDRDLLDLVRIGLAERLRETAPEVAPSPGEAVTRNA